MPLIEVESLMDPRLDPYRLIRNRNWTERSGRFIVEGLPLVRTLLDSDYDCSSILADKKFRSRLSDQIDPRIEVLLVDHACVEQIVGFQFHRGFMGCGLRKPPHSLQSDLGRLTQGETLAGLVGVQDPENVGGILRSCAALGIRHVLTGPGCADPFSRRALRVSMGNSLRLKIFRSHDVISDMRWLQREHQVVAYATSPWNKSLDVLRIEEVRRDRPALVLFGNEKTGLPSEVANRADCQIGIAMRLGVDSLNVCVAAGIILHQFSRPFGASE